MWIPVWHQLHGFWLGPTGWLALVAVLVLAGAGAAWHLRGVRRIAGAAACGYGVALTMVMTVPAWFVSVGLVAMPWPWW